MFSIVGGGAEGVGFLDLASSADLYCVAYCLPPGTRWVRALLYIYRFQHFRCLDSLDDPGQRLGAHLWVQPILILFY